MGFLDSMLGAGINRIAGAFGSWYGSYRSQQRRERDLPRFTRPGAEGKPLPNSPVRNPREYWDGAVSLEPTKLPRSKAKTPRELKAERADEIWKEALQQFQRDFLDMAAPGGVPMRARVHVPAAHLSRAQKQRITLNKSKQRGFVDTTGEFLGTPAMRQVARSAAKIPPRVTNAPKAATAPGSRSQNVRPRPRVPDFDLTNMEAVRDATFQEAATRAPTAASKIETVPIVGAISGLEPGQASAVGGSSGQRSASRSAAGKPATGSAGTRGAGARSLALPFDLSSAIGVGLGAALARQPQRVPGRSAAAIRAQVPIAQPLTQFVGQKAKTKTDTCECEKPKKRKPKAPRTTCKTGTYRQTSRGVSYRPTGEVPCR